MLFFCVTYEGLIIVYLFFVKLLAISRDFVTVMVTIVTISLFNSKPFAENPFMVSKNLKSIKFFYNILKTTGCWKRKRNNFDLRLFFGRRI